MDAECPVCGRVGEVRPGTPYPARLQCPECGEVFLEDEAPAPEPRVVLECQSCGERVCTYPALGWGDDLPVAAWKEHRCIRNLSGVEAAPVVVRAWEDAWAVATRRYHEYDERALAVLFLLEKALKLPGDVEERVHANPKEGAP